MMDFANKRLGKYRCVVCVVCVGGRWMCRCACTVFACIVGMEWCFCSLPLTVSLSDDESITSLTEFTVQKHSVRHPVSHTPLHVPMYTYIYICVYVCGSPVQNSKVILLCILIISLCLKHRIVELPLRVGLIHAS